MGPKRRSVKTPMADPADSSPTGGWAPALPGIIPPSPKDASASADMTGRPRLPQAIAHRGYSAVAPENTISAFRRAVLAGAHALETDLRLSRDGVVVLAHDPSLRRTFGENALVRDRDWAHLATLHTLRAPGEPMARLVDLLDFLNDADERADRIWVMLDVKRDSDPAEMMQRIAETIASVPSRTRPWNERILICCWNAAFLSESRKHLPEFKQAHVGFSTTYARAVLRHLPNLAPLLRGSGPPATETGTETETPTYSSSSSIQISMLRFALASPLGLGGARFVREMRDARVPLYAWTVNGDDWMRWAVRLRLDGVITDDPARFLEVCAEIAQEDEAKAEGKPPTAKRGGGGGGREGEESLVKRAVDAVKFCAWIALVEFAHLVFLAYLLWKHGGLDREVRKSFAR